MSVNSDHVTGFAVGLGATALGLYLYKKNQQQVDRWLREQGINLPRENGKSSEAMSVQELMREKERLEDMIAEREMAATEDVAAAPTGD